MNTKLKSIITITLFAVILFGFGICFLFKGDALYSESERRKLEALPKATFETILSGEFMSDFEEAAPDQFPLRDTFRKVKAYSSLKLFNQRDNNDIFVCNGHISKLSYPLNDAMLDHAGERFQNIYQSYLKDTDTKVYFSVVPDKNMFLADSNGYLNFDYDELITKMREKTEYMEYIGITDLLSANDYYFTDTHWRQECISDVADRLAEGMGTTLTHNYTENSLDAPFYGVYYGQSALNAEPDSIIYLTSDILNNSKVTLYTDGTPKSSTVYNMEAAYGKDPYEMFLSGSQPIVTIENPTPANDRELIIFRDSFASSLAPLLLSGYSEITLIDTRYINPSLIGNFAKFENQDVLFIYSVAVLNSSLGIQ